MKHTLLLLAAIASPLAAQAPAAPGPDPWKPLAFLEGTWEWKANAEGGGGAAASGSYAFVRELGGHVLARTDPGCKGPASVDCQRDLLYVYVDAPGQPLKAIYFDNEGHVIHYGVTVPTPSSVIFLSEPAGPGPQFRLVYERKENVMFGKFQAKMPGQAEWQSYLEWSGGKR